MVKIHRKSLWEGKKKKKNFSSDQNRNARTHKKESVKGKNMGYICENNIRLVMLASMWDYKNINFHHQFHFHSETARVRGRAPNKLHISAPLSKAEQSPSLSLQLSLAAASNIILSRSSGDVAARSSANAFNSATLWLCCCWWWCCSFPVTRSIDEAGRLVDDTN